jgi:hypothetical protein
MNQRWPVDTGISDYVTVSIPVTPEAARLLRDTVRATNWQARQQQALPRRP